MNKIIKYAVIGIIILGLLAYFAGENGLIAGILALVGFSGSKAIKELEKETKKFDAKADVIKEDIKKIQVDKEKLERDGVKDMTPEEEAEYWKNQ